MTTTARTAHYLGGNDDIMLELNKIYNMDCLEGMKQLDDNSIDCVVTDPPYGLKFMNKSWDYDVPSIDIWLECFRILKPGAHLLCFGGTRTYHRMAVNVEDGGFEIRDMINWIYGSGFPKSLDVGKAFDKLQGNKREVVGEAKHPTSKDRTGNKSLYQAEEHLGSNYDLTKGNSSWEGWGTGLKPAHEPIVLARKPLAGTVVDNVLKYGVGGLNIDECRISHNEPEKTTNRKQRSAVWNPSNCGFDSTQNIQASASQLGRFPANVIHDGSEEVVSLFPDRRTTWISTNHSNNRVGEFLGDLNHPGNQGFNDNGSAARFFYCAKASKAERNKGCNEIEKQIGHNRFDKCKKCGGYILQNPDRPSACKCEHPVRQDNIMKGNYHPTVKPIALMEYLIKLVSVNKAVVLDPFIGSGTTAIACKQLNRNYIGFEISKEYCDIANKRLQSTQEPLDNWID